MRHIATFALVAAAASASGACREVHGEAKALARPVKVAEAQPSPAPAGIRYAVAIQPNEQIPLAFKVGGYIEFVEQRRGPDGRARALQAGDTVRAGATLARVQPNEYGDRLAQSEASLRELEAAHTKARLDLERALTLFAADALTKPELDAAQSAFDAYTARIASARAQIDTARTALRDTALVAPSSGVILERKIEVGSLVGSGSVGFVLGNVSNVKAVFGVPDSIVHRIAPGQSLDVTTEAFRGSRFAGRVTAVSPSADQQSRVFDVEISIANGDGRLRPGMIGAVEIGGEVTAAADALAPAVPLTAVVRSDTHADRYSVFVLDESGEQPVVRSRQVTLGGVHGNLVALTRGVTAGERIVVMGATLLKDGEGVRVIR